MPAQSKQQQKFMGMVHAVQKGDLDPSDVSPKIQKAADDMKPSDAKDFASTKHAGLPKRVKQEILRKLKEYGMTLPGHHVKPSSPSVPLRNDRDMDLEESINELMLPRDVDSKMKELGIKKIPISSQGEKVLNGMVKEKFLDKVTNKERLIYFVESLGKEKFGYGVKGKPLSPLVDRFWNDITSEAIYFGGKMAAYQVAMNMKDMKRNGEQLDSPYEMMKEYFKNFGMNHGSSRVFDSAIRNLEDWMKRNNIKESRIPQNFNVGTTQDYHTKLATTPRKKYDKTNFKPQDSGQPDLEDDEVNESFNELEHLKLLNLAMKAMPGSPKQKEIIKKLNQVRIAGGMKPLKEASFHALNNPRMKKSLSNLVKDKKVQNPETGRDVSVQTAVSNPNHPAHDKAVQVKKSLLQRLKGMVKNEYASNLDNSYILNKDAEIKEENPCWNGYKQVGMKTKGGKQVPNCVKESVNESSKEDIIKDLDKAKNDLLKKVDVLIAKKKKLYSNVDIESPMTSDEKKLDKDIADLFSQINKLVLQKRNLKEGLSFNEREMVVGIIEILKQVEDRKNRMKIALNMLKKFKEEGIEFDYQKFIDHLKEYSMGSYEYDKGNRELGEAMIMQAKDVVYKVVPKSTFARFASDPKKNKEFVDSIVRDLTYLLNRFYKQNNIDLILK